MGKRLGLNLPIDALLFSSEGMLRWGEPCSTLPLLSKYFAVARDGLLCSLLSPEVSFAYLLMGKCIALDFRVRWDPYGFGFGIWRVCLLENAGHRERHPYFSIVDICFLGVCDDGLGAGLNKGYHYGHFLGLIAEGCNEGSAADELVNCCDGYRCRRRADGE